MPDIIILITAVIMLMGGLIGCLLPVIPGPPLSYIGLLLIHFTPYAGFSTSFLLIMAGVTVAVTLFDLVAPVWAVKKTGGSRYGLWGAAIGMIIGILLFFPLGLVFGAFAGAITGELLNGRSFREAVIAGTGSFIGFMLGTGIKLGASVVMTIYFLGALL